MNRQQQLPIFDGQDAAVGRWRFDIEPLDGFGTKRATEFGHARIMNFQIGTSAVKVSDERIFEKINLRNVFLHLENACECNLRRLAPAFARAFRMVVDRQWPLLTAAWPEGRRASVRLNLPVDEPLPKGYLAAADQTQIRVDVAAAIAALQKELEREAECCAAETEFAAKYGVQRILTVGSTSRETYAGNAVDFDLVIHSETKQADILREDIRRLADRLVSRITQSRQYSTYVQYIKDARAELEANSIQESFFGVRGKESFVCRYELILKDGKHNLFDITFGHLPQLVGYEIWIQRYLNELHPSLRQRIRGEIRLAKCLLREMGDLYGVGIAGFRGNLVEQFIIQNCNYRSRGSPIGSLANSLELIADELGRADGTIKFEEYKNSFPLWHPGRLETAVGFSGNQASVNIWDLLGNGDRVVSERQWNRLKALAFGHRHVLERDMDWSVANVVTAGRTILEGGNNAGSR